MFPHLLFFTNQVPSQWGNDFSCIKSHKDPRYTKRIDSTHMYTFKQFKDTLRRYMLILWEFCIYMCKQIGQHWEGGQWLIKEAFLEESVSVSVLGGKNAISESCKHLLLFLYLVRQLIFLWEPFKIVKIISVWPLSLPLTVERAAELPSCRAALS